jgi:hypothetical protein
MLSNSVFAGPRSGTMDRAQSDAARLRHDRRDATATARRVPRITAILAVLALSVASAACDNRSRPANDASLTAEPARSLPPDALRLPLKAGSVRFAAIGDAGRGDQPQFQVSLVMQAYRRLFPFNFVIMLGDNVYDGGTVEDYRQKFERPYKAFLDDGVEFYATIGNHDDFNQPHYPAFHMGGQRYYTFKPPSLLSRVLGTDVRFFMIDTENLNLTELAWLEQQMTESKAAWKIPVFHRPVYTSGRYDLGARYLRSSLEPIFRRHGVAVAFSGHEHFYQRTKPQNGITYFISGGAGSLRIGDLRPSPITAAGYDRDYHFMLIEIDGDELYYQVIARTGQTIDAGVVQRTPDAVPHLESR